MVAGYLARGGRFAGRHLAAGGRALYTRARNVRMGSAVGVGAGAVGVGVGIDTATRGRGSALGSLLPDVQGATRDISRPLGVVGGAVALAAVAVVVLLAVRSK